MHIESGRVSKFPIDYTDVERRSVPFYIETVLKIGSNISSLTAQRRLGESTDLLAGITERLGSGMRINRASDDPAGLSLSAGLRTSARIHAQAIRNLNDGVSLLNVAEGALDQLSGIMTRQKELAEQAANGVYSTKQRQALSAESDALVKEYNRIVQSTSYNGLKLYQGDMSQGLALQAGHGTGTVLTMKLGDALSQNVGDGTFGERTGYTNGVWVNGPVTAAVGDLNNDGYEDFLTGNYWNGNIDINRGGPNGTFTGFSWYSVAAGNATTHDIELNDLNKDGYLDVISANDTAGHVTVLMNRGDGTFNGAMTFYGVPSARSVAVEDLDRDGKEDLVVTTGYQGIAVFKGNGDGTFKAAISYGWISGADALDLGDVNGDGVTDAVVGGSYSDRVGVLIGNADGSFNAARRYHSVGAKGTTLGDFNRDGILDMANSVNGSSAYSTINLRLGNGDGTFGAATTITTGSNPYDITSGDFNGDGIIDLISAETDSDTLSVFLGNGDGTFKARSSIASFGDPEDVIVKDINHDGVLDLFMGEFDLTSVAIRLGNSVKRAEIGFLDLTTQAGSRASLDSISKTMERISSEKGMIGALQSRLKVATQNLMTQRENEIVADSRIAEADVAQEAAALVRVQILQQAGAAVLAQANQSPSLALSLLQ